MQKSGELQQAVAILHDSGLVAFPTETVYGLGADARNPDALANIFTAKGRPADHPLIVHVAEMSQLSDWASAIPEVAYRLAEAFWPGPMTLILQKNPAVHDLVTGGQNTVGVRIPRHPVAQALLKAFGGGLAAPSANRFGRISPTTAAAVKEELGSAVDLILEGGQCAVGVESTIIDVSSGVPKILRPGMINALDISSVAGMNVAVASASTIRVSGSHESHYAPRTPTFLIPAGAVGNAICRISAGELPVVVLHYSNVGEQVAGCELVKMSDDVKDYAHDLYLMLRAADQRQAQRILVEKVPEDIEWDGVRDRLARACK